MGYIFFSLFILAAKPFYLLPKVAQINVIFYDIINILHNMYNCRYTYISENAKKRYTVMVYSVINSKPPSNPQLSENGNDKERRHRTTCRQM